MLSNSASSASSGEYETLIQSQNDYDLVDLDLATFSTEFGILIKTELFWSNDES